MKSLRCFQHVLSRDIVPTSKLVRNPLVSNTILRDGATAQSAGSRCKTLPIQTSHARSFATTRPTPFEQRHSGKRAKWSQFSPSLSLAAVIAVAGGAAVDFYEGWHERFGKREEEVIVEPKVQGIRITEVAKHDRNAETKWIVHGKQVFDITDFIESHPGGEVILRACGGSIDPYWKIFTIHKKPEVEDILKQYLIGELDPRDIDETGEVRWASLGAGHELTDPFFDDPLRDERLHVHTARPCNAETPAELLTKHFITPIRLFFVRNHLWVPRINPDLHELTIEFSDGEESMLTLADLKGKFKEHTITATLQCAGNRRKHMSQSNRGQTSGLQWDIGAISTAEFTGVRLCDVLRDAGYDESGAEENDEHHVQFSAPGDTYSASIPLSTALSRSSDVLLAYKMNGEEMNRDHGGPLRVIVPGTTAARSVKWVGRVTISPDESHSQWQRRDYKCFGPNVKASEVSSEDWDREQSIQETPVQSAITKIKNNEDGVSVQGFAFSGGGRAIVRVDVSSDGGKTWKQAQIQEDDAKGSKRWAWSLWNIQLPKTANVEEKVEYVVKATDNSYNSQPEDFDSIWNFRGLLANAWHRVVQ